MTSARNTTNSDPAPAPAPATATVPKSAPTADIDAINAAALSPTAHSTSVPLMAGANGSGSSPASATTTSASTNKKRKKDGLKPIITTEGPAPVVGSSPSCLAIVCSEGLQLLADLQFHGSIPRIMRCDVLTAGQRAAGWSTGRAGWLLPVQYAQP
ncbi:hypothetical protein F4823DRAFT_518892 [Ustulina deusta]|nr:hypothetical protein F4823DRAFT_518892 [Ustulina deusta]